MRRPRSGGFTLLEGLIAMVVFMIGVIGVIASLISARGATAMARRAILANAVATDLAEQIDAWPYDESRLSATTESPCKDDPADTQGALERSGASYSSFLACAYDEDDLTGGELVWGGLPRHDDGDVRFTYDSAADVFKRYWVVREENRDGTVASTSNTGVRKRIWVHVTYGEGGARRKVTRYVTKFRVGGL
ncbi:MAG: type IV pilus modification PilV family protein [Myxococcales bacterium]